MRRRGVWGRWPRLVQGSALAVLAVVALAHAQDALAPAGGGTAFQDSGLRGQIEAAFVAGGRGNPPPPSAGPAWLITPAISVQQEWTDNALQNSGVSGATGQAAPKQASFITVVVPSLSISGSTSRLTANFNYAPSVSYYSSVQGQNQVAQNLDATVLVTLIPDQLFLDLRGFAAVQSLGGASGPQGTQALSRQNQVQSYSFSASPYLDHRFGGWGTGQIGVSDSETSQGAVSGNLTGGLGSQSVNTRAAFASFASGENFGRVLSNVKLLAQQSNGTGVLQGAYHDTASYQAGYAITHGITALAGVGWEDIRYGTPANLHIADATWSVGAKLTPNPDSSITVLYGHQDGVTAASLNASYAPTVRTRLYATYMDGISTDTEQLQTALANATLDSLGNPVNPETGAPLLLTDNFFGITDAVYRTRNASVTASWLLDREALQATVNYQRQTPVGAVTTGTFGAVASDGAYGSLAWQHDVSAALATNLFVEYGKLSQSVAGGAVDSNVVVATASVSYRITETLTGSFEYSYTSDSYAEQTPNTAANLVVLGLRKTF
jgi:uncharacterized protein (PEP-CTERM system associated)